MVFLVIVRQCRTLYQIFRGYGGYFYLIDLINLRPAIFPTIELFSSVKYSLMSGLKAIPVVIESGQKYRTEQGYTAIKDGIKSHQEEATLLPKPDWLRVRLSSSPRYAEVKNAYMI